MNQPIVLRFVDFKSVSGKHRIYFYEGFDFFDFHLLVDGHIVKSRLMKDTIDNYERFFSDKMFYGAMRLEFNIPVDDGNPLMFATSDEAQTLDVNIQEEEVKNTDLQRDGVDAEDDDKMTLTINDDLSGLLYLRVGAGAKVETR